ncbi:MAG: hypothetical protein GX325_08770 [Peptococcaceae bacterium]|nr:hypothetical protein [Peptococcaceae bacterium]
MGTKHHITINETQIKRMIEKGLSPKDLAEILRVGEKQVQIILGDAMEGEIHELDCPYNKKILLIPLLKGQIKQYKDRDLSIKYNYLSYYLILERTISHLGLGEIYVALKVFSGHEGLINPNAHKVSFGFYFLIKILIANHDEAIEYLLLARDYKGGLEFRFHKIIKESEKDKFRQQLTTYNKPFSQELNRNEMDGIIGYIAGYINGVTRNINEWYHEEFSRSVDSVKLCYGYKNGSFYQYQGE